MLIIKEMVAGGDMSDEQDAPLLRQVRLHRRRKRFTRNSKGLAISRQNIVHDDRKKASNREVMSI